MAIAVPRAVVRVVCDAVGHLRDVVAEDEERDFEEGVVREESWEQRSTGGVICPSTPTENG